MDRDTLTIKTPVGGQEVVLKSYLTGREKRTINSVFLQDVEIQSSTKAGDTPTMTGLKGDIMQKAEDIALTTVVMSIDGKNEKILDTLLEMHSQDFDFVVKEINKITQDADFEEVK